MSIGFKKGKLPVNKEDRLKYLYRLQEKLRLYHNIKGKEARDGKISMAQFRKFQRGWFKKRNSLLCGEINKIRNSFTKEDRKKYLEYDEEEKAYCGAIKNKRKYQQDKTINTSIEDIEEK